MVESTGLLEKWRHYFHSSYITVIMLHNSCIIIVKTVGYSCVPYVVNTIMCTHIILCGGAINAW